MEGNVGNPFEILSLQLERIERILVELRDEVRAITGQTSPNDDGVSLAANVTGLKKKTIYNLVSKKQIPHYKKGGRLYFDKQELIEWKKSGKHLSLTEIGKGSIEQFPLRRTRRGRSSVI